MKRFAKETSRRLAVHQQRDLGTKTLPVFEGVIDTHVTRNRNHVNRTIR
ncbi:hypothetical protein AWB69_09270 [Caballeronia udeis]|uniref:Uncharacterized protein n=1 Tax=Caballeronia udeis TaxID=1232866 RepID=A0A158K1M1_9BURK|nr:hypothetical protein AWB69_09270 [Caballeronia udeis]